MSVNAQQPLINKKLLIRTVLFMFGLAVAIGIYTYFKNRGADADSGELDTKGWVAAIRHTGSDSQIVAIKPDGTIVESPDFVKGSRDRDAVWRPDGNRIFFSSDREEKAFNIYRWNLATNKVVRRTLGKIGKTDPSFSYLGTADSQPTNPLMVYGGMVWRLDASTGKGEQIVPVKSGKNSVDENTQRDDSTGESLGSFGQGASLKAKSARFFGGNEWMAILRQTDNGEELMAQRVGKDSSPENRRVIVVGERVLYDVDPKSGNLVYSVWNFQWPDPQNVPKQFIHNGIVEKPYQYALGLFAIKDGAGKGTLLAPSPNPSVVFGQPRFSPDGTRILVAVGSRSPEGALLAKQLFTLPPTPGDKLVPTRVYPAAKMIDANLFDPVWSPDGSRIAVTQVSPDGSRTILIMDKDGGNVRDLTAGKGQFDHPVFSPQN